MKKEKPETGFAKKVEPRNKNANPDVKPACEGEHPDVSEFSRREETQDPTPLPGRYA